MTGRRSFLIGCGGLVAAPVIALIDLPRAMGEVPRSMPPAAPVPLGSAGAITPKDLVLRVDGWDSPSVAGPAAEAEVWVHFNSSWRSAWR